MRVLKIINNNVVSCTDEAGRESIAMGKGIGFGAHAGDELPGAQVEKLFRMDTQGDTDRLADLLATLPAEQITVCTQIIAYASHTVNKRLSKSIYITLTDHICFAIGRKQEGLVFQNPLLTEVRIFYPREFAAGRHALTLISDQLGVDFPEDEAASIALHLVNAEYDTSISDTMHITQALHDILGILNRWPGLALREDSLYYDELTVHLKFLAMRTFAGTGDDHAEPAFVHTIQTTYPSEYACAGAVARYLEKQSGHAVSGECRAYLALYIHRSNGK